MKFLKVGGVIFGALLLTTLGINASDVFNGNSGSLLGQIIATQEDVCPGGTMHISLSDKDICIDIYENSVGEECDLEHPSSIFQTKQNIDNPLCYSESYPDVKPWTYVSQHQAKSLCVKKGARLANTQEWYEGALGTPDDTLCNLNGTVRNAGSFESCVSYRGLYDTVGNVWEWVDGEVVDGQYNNRQVPESGYVAEIDAQGVPLETTSTSSELYNKDYFWGDMFGNNGVMRGGFYGSKDDGGVYATHMKVAQSFAGEATGFRCVYDL